MAFFSLQCQDNTQIARSHTVANLETGADLYVSLRRRWNSNIIALAKYMEYDWSAIAPSVVQGVD